MSIRTTVQSTLDTALTTDRVYVHWQKKAEIPGDTNPDEYIVYTMGGDYDRVFADDEPLVKEADVTLRYYYRAEKLDTNAGRTAIETRQESILAAMKSAGFYTPSGFFDAGDVDDIGFLTSVSEWNYARTV